MSIAIATVAALLLLYAIIFMPLHFSPRTVDTLDQNIRHLYSYGHSGATLYIAFSYTHRRLELWKYVVSPEETGIMLCLPRKRWTEPHFEAVTKLSREMGLECEEIETLLGRRRPTEFLVVPFGTDFDVAFRFVKALLIDILGAYFERISRERVA